MGCIVSKLFWIFIYFLYLHGPLYSHLTSPQICLLYFELRELDGNHGNIRQTLYKHKNIFHFKLCVQDTCFSVLNIILLTVLVFTQSVDNFPPIRR